MDLPAADPAALLAAHLPAALAVARALGRFWPWLSADFESDAGLAVWKAAVAYRPDRGPFGRLARRHARWACLRRLAIERCRNPVAFRAPPRTADGFADPLALVAGDGPDPAASAELADLLAALPPDVRAAAELIAEGYTRDQVGAAAGVSGEAIRQRIDRAARRLAAA